MVITRTPYRISFLGGGTDYPEWYREQGGAVLGTAIDKYCYISCRYLPPFFEHRFRIVYSKIEDCQYLSEIQHPVVRGILCSRDYDRGLEVHHDGDLPARSGMGSSSAFTVGFLQALDALSGRLSSKEALAREAIHVERDVLKETVGCQDQMFAAFGGLNVIEFRRDDSFVVQPLPLSQARLSDLNASLLLFFTGVRRIASQIAATYVTDLRKKRVELVRLRQMVDEGTELLTANGSLDGFGDLLHEAWQLKRGLSGAVSNSRVDEIYEAARTAGARGGKLLGAGGGGFMLFYAPPERHQRIKETLRDLLWVPFNFDTGGSQVVLYSPGQDYAELDRCRSVAQRNLLERRRKEISGQDAAAMPQPSAPGLSR